MNLFLVGCNMSQHHILVAPGMFKSTAADIPNIDPSTYWNHYNDAVFVATMHHSAAVSAPRSYLHADDHGAVLFDGSLFDPVSKCVVDDAAWLAAKWDTAPGRIEGQFVAIKILFQPATVELFNDHLGLYRVYYGRCGDGFFLSNSLRLLTRLRGDFSLDPTAIAMKVAHGHAMGARTFQQGFRSFTGGDHWRWAKAKASPKMRRYFDRSRWSHPSKQVKSSVNIRALSEKMVLPLKKMAQRYGSINAPLTAGRDSRVLFAMLHGAGVASRYFSVGDSNLVDVRIGSQIARHYQLEHRLRILDDQDLKENWIPLARQLIQNTAGTVSMVHVANIINRPDIDSLGIMLYGACGEYARNLQINSKFYWNRLTLAGLQRHLIGHYEKSEKVLARGEAIETSRQIVREQIRELAHEGFQADDILLAHYMFNRSPHLAGCMARLLAPYYDVYCPYCTPSFAEAAFTEPLINRYGDHLHYRMIYSLLPELHELPIQYPWRLRHPVITAMKMLRKDVKDLLFAKSVSKKPSSKKVRPGNQTIRYRRARWLNAVIGQYRSLCLEQQNSMIWDLVDRNAFEKITSEEGDSTQLWRHQDEIFDAITLFEYAHGGRS